MEKLLTPEQVADILQVSVKTVKNWLRAGKLQGIKTGQLWRIEPEALDEYLNRQRVAQQLELEAKVRKEGARRMKQGRRSYAVLGFGCEKCGHTFILDISFEELMEKVAEGESFLCPKCGERIEKDLFTPEGARGFLERQEELRKEYEESESKDKSKVSFKNVKNVDKALKRKASEAKNAG
jgi:excisionase family DNA binding protein